MSSELKVICDLPPLLHRKMIAQLLKPKMDVNQILCDELGPESVSLMIFISFMTIKCLMSNMENNQNRLLNVS